MLRHGFLKSLCLSDGSLLKELLFGINLYSVYILYTQCIYWCTLSVPSSTQCTCYMHSVYNMYPECI